MQNRSNISLLAAVIAVSGLFLWYASSPAQSRLSEVRAETKETKLLIDREMERMKSLSSIQNQVERMRESTRQFNAAVPGDEGLGEFLNRLGAILERNGLKNHIFQPQTVVEADARRVPAELLTVLGTIKVKPILIKCNGEFKAIHQMLADIERLPRLTQIDSLELHADPTDSRVIHVEILMNLYFMPGGVDGTATGSMVKP